MKGLLIKELYNLKNYLIIYYSIDIVVYIMFYIFSFIGIKNLNPQQTINSTQAMGLLFMNSVASVSYLLYFAMYLIHISFEIDEKSNFAKFIISIGVSRDKVVKTKVGVGFMGYLIPLIFLICMSFSPMYIGEIAPFFGIEKVICSVILFVFSILLNIAITLSIACYLEISKARIVSSIVTIFIISLEVAFYALILFYDTPVIKMQNYYIYIITTILAIVFLIISTFLYTFSVKQYNKKEF